MKIDLDKLAPRRDLIKQIDLLYLQLNCDIKITRTVINMTAGLKPLRKQYKVLWLINEAFKHTATPLEQLQICNYYINNYSKETAELPIDELQSNEKLYQFVRFGLDSILHGFEAD